MKKFITVLTVIAAFVPSFAANAAAMSGTVKSVDSSHDAITLNDGSTYTLAEGSEAEDFKPGRRLRLPSRSKTEKTSPRASKPASN